MGKGKKPVTRSEILKKGKKRPAYAKGGATVSNKDMAMALQILMKKLGMKPPK